MSKPFILATRNRHKGDEFTQMLGLKPGALLSALDFPEIPDVIEDGDTFEANAIKKARALCAATGLIALADDSGLEVDALGGAPGVRSARYAGEPADYAANNRKLLAALAGQTNRQARFRCVLALAQPGDAVQTVTGVCEGEIALEPRGVNGFGYDPLFVPHTFTRTFAELPPETKNRLSHRADALARARLKWGEILIAGL